MTEQLRVLIIEDSPADADLELIELRRGGYQPICERVDTPEDLRAALDRPWDIILSDYVMPRFSGPSALKLVRDMNIDVPFIVVTGQVGEETAVETMRAGANDYVLKSNLTRLTPAIQRELKDADVRRERRLAGEALRRAHEELRLANAELERRVAERTKELDAERERLAITLRCIGDAVIATDTRGRVTLMNGVAQALTGWTEEEARERPLTQVFHIINEESRAVCENPVNKVLDSGLVVELANHTVLVAKHGFERIIADSAAPICGDDGSVFGVVLVFRDVTERKRDEEKAAQLAAIVESSDDAIIGKTLEGIITSWNLAAERLYGYSASEIIGQSLAIVMPPDQPDELPRLLESVRRGEKIEHYETIRLRKGGERIHVSITVSPIRDADGNVIGASTITRDLTERKRAEMERDNLLAEFEGVFSSIADGVVIVGPNGEILRMNPAASQLLDLSAEQQYAATPFAERAKLLNARKPDGSVLPLEENPSVRALRGETVRGMPVVITTPSGRVVSLKASAAPLRTADDKLLGAVTTLTGIT